MLCSLAKPWQLSRRCVSWDVDTTTSYCRYRFLASLIRLQPECLHVAWLQSWWYSTQHSTHESCLLWHPALGGESVVRTCVVISSSPQPSSSLCLRHQNLYQHSAGSGIMSLFVSPMSHLVHFEDQDVCHEFCICRNYWPVCCADWVSPHLTHASKCSSLHQVSPHNSQLRIYDRETGQEC